MYENDKQILENDILVLYILNKFDIMITEKSLTDIILTPGLVNYFSFQDSLKKLIENNFVSVFNDNDGTGRDLLIGTARTRRTGILIKQLPVLADNTGGNVGSAKVNTNVIHYFCNPPI